MAASPFGQMWPKSDWERVAGPAPEEYYGGVFSRRWVGSGQRRPPLHLLSPAKALSCGLEEVP